MTLLLPVDGCPSCVGAVAHPSMTELTDQGLCAWYRCPRCLWSWKTWWDPELASLPCRDVRCEACRTNQERQQ